MDPLLTATTASDDTAMRAETDAYVAAARRGDVLPTCIRLSATRRDGAWSQRLVLTREAGPVCPQDVLDRACSFMPEAPEPRLLRAARSIAIAQTVPCRSARHAWLAFARHDLLEAARLDPMDGTVRTMLADLVGANAWAFRACAA